MSRPTARVLATLELLQTHGRMSGTELSRRLQVDSRTVRRYIVTLEELGIPITAERGRDGHYTLVSGFKLPPMMFTDDEALALAVGLQAARGIGLAEAHVAVAGALAKLERVMPAGLKRRVRAVGETVAIGLTRSTAPGDNRALGALSEAAQTENRVRLRYRSRPGEETDRDFDAYGLAYRGGFWYALGWCHLRRGLRSFRLDRIQSVRLVARALHAPRGVRRPRPPRALRGDASPCLLRRGALEAPTSRPPSASCSPPSACSSGREAACSSGAKWTACPGSPASWPGCPSTSRSESPRPCVARCRIVARRLLARTAR